MTAGSLNNLLRGLLVVCVLMSASPAYSLIEFNEFSDSATQERYKDLIDELRCPKCQNQNLTDSNSQISIDLRKKVRKLIEEGLSDAEIKQHLVARYGDFVLYRPEVKKETLVLWYAPVLLLLLGFLALLMILIANKKTKKQTRLTTAAENELSDVERAAQVKRLMAENSEK